MTDMTDMNAIIRRKAGRPPRPAGDGTGTGEQVGRLYEELLSLRASVPESWGRLSPATRAAVESFAATKHEQQEK